MPRKKVPYPAITFNQDNATFNQYVMQSHPGASYMRVYLHDSFPMIKLKFGDHVLGAVKLTHANVNYVCSSRQLLHIMHERSGLDHLGKQEQLYHHIPDDSYLFTFSPDMDIFTWVNIIDHKDFKLQYLYQREPMYGIAFEWHVGKQYRLRFNKKFCDIIDDDGYTNCLLAKDGDQYIIQFNVEDGSTVTSYGARRPRHKSYVTTCSKMVPDTLKPALKEGYLKYGLEEHPNMMDTYILVPTHVKPHYRKKLLTGG